MSQQIQQQDSYKILIILNHVALNKTSAAGHYKKTFTSLISLVDHLNERAIKVTNPEVLPKFFFERLRPELRNSHLDNNPGI